MLHREQQEAKKKIELTQIVHYIIIQMFVCLIAVHLYPGHKSVYCSV
jgi:hypothetical protein